MVCFFLFRKTGWALSICFPGKPVFPEAPTSEDVFVSSRAGSCSGKVWLHFLAVNGDMSADHDSSFPSNCKSLPEKIDFFGGIFWRKRSDDEPTNSKTWLFFLKKRKLIFKWMNIYIYIYEYMMDAYLYLNTLRNFSGKNETNKNYTKNYTKNHQTRLHLLVSSGQASRCSMTWLSCFLKISSIAPTSSGSSFTAWASEASMTQVIRTPRVTWRAGTF